MPALPPNMQNLPAHQTPLKQKPFKQTCVSQEHIRSEDVITEKQKNTPQANPPLRKLDGRLMHLYQWATQKNYHHIWDLCCDHGRLGLHLHNSVEHSKSHIHLIDQVPKIIDSLKIHCKNIPKDRLTLRCMDASQIQLAPTSHLIIVAGIGGKTAIKIIKALLTQRCVNASKSFSIDLLLSTTNHIYTLREYLNTTPFNAIDEEFIHEKGQSYEHLFYRLSSAQKTNQPDTKAQNPAGSGIWHPMTPEKEHYLTKIIHHYQSCQQPSKATTKALKHYQVALNAATPPR